MTENDPPDFPNAFSIRQMPDCFYVHFDNLPLDASSLTLNSIDTTDPERVHISATAVFTRLELVRLNYTGLVIMPFVSPGRDYTISAVLHWPEREFPNDRRVMSLRGRSTASGIKLVNDISISLDKRLSVCALSDEPAFSKNVDFLSPKYTFSALAFSAKPRLLAGSTNSLSWSWDFHAGKIGTPGDHSRVSKDYAPVPAYLDVSCNILFDEVSWEVCIASTGTFAVNLYKAKALPAED